MQVGDVVNLVRKITGEVLPVTLTEVLVKTLHPAVEVQWKSPRHRYKLDLVKNEVLAIDCTPDHRQSMRSWYMISEEHRLKLIDLFWYSRKTGGKK
jgi:chromosome condensin MukBEF MukE localization factor